LQSPFEMQHSGSHVQLRGAQIQRLKHIMCIKLKRQVGTIKMRSVWDAWILEGIKAVQSAKKNHIPLCAKHHDDLYMGEGVLEWSWYQCDHLNTKWIHEIALKKDELL
jgi:hypothetical protein